MTIDLQESTESFINAVDQYRSGLCDEAPLIDCLLLRDLDCTYESSTSAICRSTAACNPDAGPYLLSLLIAIAPHPWAAKQLAPVLSGISCNRGLTDCLETEEGAYAMATALTGYLEHYRDGCHLDMATAYQVLVLLNEWAMPAERWSMLPSPGDFCRRIFSEAWCSIALPNGAYILPEQSESRQRVVADMLVRDRPPFLPGMCPEHASPTRESAVPVKLPDNLVLTS
jgi:hypothetical protein